MRVFWLVRASAETVAITWALCGSRVKVSLTAARLCLPLKGMTLQVRASASQGVLTIAPLMRAGWEQVLF